MERRRVVPHCEYLHRAADSPSLLPPNVRRTVGMYADPTACDVLGLVDKITLYENDDRVVLVVGKPTPPPATSKPAATRRFSRLLGDEPKRLCVPQLLRLRVMKGCHTDMSCYRGSA